MIPIRDKNWTKNMELSYLEKVSSNIITRHKPFLNEIERKDLLKVLRVVQKISAGGENESCIKEAEEELEDYPSESSSDKRSDKKKVSFREGPHDVQHFIKDDNDVLDFEVEDFEVEQPDEAEEDENKIETNFTWNDEDDDEFVF